MYLSINHVNMREYIYEVTTNISLRNENKEAETKSINVKNF